MTPTATAAKHKKLATLLLALIASAGLIASSCSTTNQDETTPPPQPTTQNTKTTTTPNTATPSSETNPNVNEGTGGVSDRSPNGPQPAAEGGNTEEDTEEVSDRSPNGPQPAAEGGNTEEDTEEVSDRSPNGPQPAAEGGNTEEDTEEVSDRSPNGPQPVVGGDEGLESEPETVRILHECDVDLFECTRFADTDSFDQKLPCSQQLTVSDEVVRQQAEAMTQEIASGVRGITQKQAEALAMGLAVCEAEFSEITHLARQGNVGIQFIKLVMGFMSGNYRDFIAAYYRLPCMVAPYEFSIQIMTPSRLRRLISAVREAALFLYKPTNQQITNINQELALPEVTTNLLTEISGYYNDLYLHRGDNVPYIPAPYGTDPTRYNQVPCGNFLRVFPDLYHIEDSVLDDSISGIVGWDFLRKSPGPYY